MARNIVAVLVRLVVGLLAVVVGSVAGWLVFVEVPDSLAELLGILLTVGVVLAAVRVGSQIARNAYPTYNAAEVAVEGPISRDPSGVGPASGGTPADDLVEQIERADEDTAARALLLKLNTPGGEVLPSEDIRSAAAAFDGPTVAYATDQCASGGMWIASGCDELWAREASQVGSIGVLGVRPNLHGFFDDRGITFEEITAGEYKDASLPVTEFSDADRSYLQGLTDGFYDQFVERVADGMDLDPETVRETEARVYLGRDAADIGLVDALGDREDVEDRVAELLDEEPRVESFEPERGLRDRVGVGARRVAYSVGAGLADRLAPDEDVTIRL